MTLHVQAPETGGARGSAASWAQQLGLSEGDQVVIDFSASRMVAQGFADALVAQLCQDSRVSVTFTGADERRREYLLRSARLRGVENLVTVV